MPHRRADEYVRHAQEAIEMAEHEPDPQARAIFLNMAETWLRLAEQAMAARQADREPPATT